MRLIDANALRDNAINKANVDQFVFDNCFPYWQFSKAIEEAPAVDGVEVVHGRWERCFEDWRQQIEGDKCSACGFEHYGCGIKHFTTAPTAVQRWTEKGKTMKKKLLRVAERILSVMLSSFACLGMFLLINFVVGLFGKELSTQVMWAIVPACLFLTACLKNGYMYVRYLLLEIMGQELENKDELTADELADHLKVKIW